MLLTHAQQFGYVPAQMIPFYAYLSMDAVRHLSTWKVLLAMHKGHVQYRYEVRHVSGGGQRSPPRGGVHSCVALPAGHSLQDSSVLLT